MSFVVQTRLTVFDGRGSGDEKYVTRDVIPGM